MAKNTEIEEFDPIEEFEEQETPSIQSVLGNKAIGAAKGVGNFIGKFIPSAETIEDTAAGGLQGATAGFIDEMTGVAKAGTDIALGDNTLEQFPELYRQFQRASEAEYDASKARSPKAFLGGEIGGGLLAGLATAGAGVGTAGMIPLREAAKIGGKEVAKQLGRRAVAGGTAGAVTAVGTSKYAVEENPEKLAADAIGGGVMGATLGAGLPAIGATIGAAGRKVGKVAGEYIQDSPLLRQATKSFGMGKAGKVISEGEKAVGSMADEQLQDISEISNVFRTASDKIGRAIGGKLKQATEQGVTIKTDGAMQSGIDAMGDLLKSNRFLFKSKDSGTVLALLEKFKAGALTPLEAKTLKDVLYDAGKNTEAAEFKNIFFGLRDQINDALNSSVDGLKPLNALYSEFLSSGPEVLLTKGQPADISKKFLSELDAPHEKVAQAITEMLSTLTSPGVSKTAARRTYSELMRKMNEFNANHPGVLKTLGVGDPAEFGKKMFEKADKFAIQRQALGYEPHGSPLTNIQHGVMGAISNTGRGVVVSGANLAGRAIKGASEAAPARFSRSLYHAADDELKSVSSQLIESGIPGVKNMGDALLKGLETKNQAAKNAALFTILQDPRARLLIKGEEVGEQDERSVQGNRE